MRIELYVDVYPGIDVKYLCAYASPVPKGSYSKRYKLIAESPDPNEPDKTVKAAVMEDEA